MFYIKDSIKENVLHPQLYPCKICRTFQKLKSLLYNISKFQYVSECVLILISVSKIIESLSISNLDKVHVKYLSKVYFKYQFSALLDSICSKLSKFMYFEFTEIFLIDIFLLSLTYSNKKRR